MIRYVLSFGLSMALSFSAFPLRAAPPSADDFLPPVQAASEEQRQALTQVQGPVEQVKDPVTGQNVVQAQSAQDAINTVVARRAAGSEMVRFGSGIGWVATGAAVYEVMENPTATRISRRDAYVRAFLDAKRHLAESMKGLSTTGRTQILEQMETLTTAQADLTNAASSQEEKMEQAVRMLMRGFVIYGVEDDTEKRTVFVSIVTTPKTRGQLNRPTPNGLEAESVREGLNKVLVEVQNGLVPPVGGRIIQVPDSGEIAFVGFGSDVVRTSSNPAMQAKQRLNADKVAQMRAADALVGMLIGDDTGWKAKLDEVTKKTIAEFEGSDGGADPSQQRFAQQSDAFRNVQKSSEEFQSIRQGVLPPGVTRKSFASKDEGEMYAIAVYVPSYTAAAAKAAKEMAEARPFPPPAAAGAPAVGGAGQETVPRPSKEVGTGPTGQVSRDKDL